MEIKIDISENMLFMIKSYGKGDLTSIINEALATWTHKNMFRCPLDEALCSSKEACNICPKATKLDKK